MGSVTGRVPARAMVAVIVITGAVVVLLLAPDLPGLDDTLVANLVAMVMSAIAMGCAVWRALRSAGRRRGAWTALSAALFCWTTGAALWTWLQATGQQPFPSVADIGYLGFGPLVCLGLLLLPAAGGRINKLRAVLDGVSTSWALLLISWETALGAAIEASRSEDLYAAAVSIAYPVMDVVVTVLALLTFARVPAGAGRRSPALLAAGLLAISAADSVFVYLTATTGYEPGGPLDIWWSIGFGCLAMAALVDRPVAARSTEAPREVAMSGGYLPYVPVVGVLLAVIYMQLNGRSSTLWEELAEHGLVLLLIVRQYLTLRQNIRLREEVDAGHQELHHQAFHDALTGLANRALFRDRLEHALELHARDGRPVGVLFLDLDDFKIVNDTLGHTVGDELLVRIAERLDTFVRAGDTVARLGGDEFAMLLETGGEPRRCAERVTDLLRDPYYVGGHTVRATASVGVVELAMGDTPVAADVLLARADIAMYAAKRAGKGRIRHAVPADR